MTSQDLVVVLEALASLDMGRLPLTTQLRSTTNNHNTSTSSKAARGKKRKASAGEQAISGSRASAGGKPVVSQDKLKEDQDGCASDGLAQGRTEARGKEGLPSPLPSASPSPVLQLQQVLLARLQPRLKHLQLPQVGGQQVWGVDGWVIGSMVGIRRMHVVKRVVNEGYRHLWAMSVACLRTAPKRSFHHNASCMHHTVTSFSQ
jgi:hypothetical protein